MSFLTPSRVSPIFILEEEGGSDSGGGTLALKQRPGLFIGLVAFATFAGWAVASAAGAGRLDPYKEWGCPKEWIATTINEFGEPKDGFTSAQDALRNEVELLSIDGVGPVEEYLAALGTDEGESRFEKETGRLFIDNRIKAQFGIVQFTDGTWAVETVVSCMPPVTGEST